MNQTDKKIIDEIILTKNSADETIKGYYYAVDKYTDCHQMSLRELLKEAEYEEDNHIPLRKRKIKTRLVTFQQYLTDNRYAVSSVNMYIIKIKAVYNFFDFELPQVHRIKDTKFKTIDDIPSLDDVKLAIQNTNNLKLQAMILFCVSSGCAKKEVMNLTIKDFMYATKDYHNTTNITDMINILLTKDDAIPLFSIFRQKTNKPYYCCCSPEAVTKICIMLKQRSQISELKIEDKLFDMSVSYVGSMFRHINTKLGFGYVNGYSYFRPHSLRMRFQTELAKAQIDPNYYEHMLGHKLNAVQEVYIQIDPETVRSLYKKVVGKLCVYKKVSYIDINSDDRRELLNLRQELKEIKQKLVENGYN